MDLRVLLFEDNKVWIAQLLELYITAQGETVEDAVYELSRLIHGEIAMRRQGMMQPLDDTPKAPNRYWEWYEDATPFEHSLAPFTMKEPNEHSDTLTIECRKVAA